MSSFQGIGGFDRKVRRACRQRPKRQPFVERLESRVVLNGSLTSGSSTPVTATAGSLVSGAPLVTFTDGTSPLPANEYAATIDWGDGTPLSGGTISLSGTTFTVTGSHNFPKPSSALAAGDYTVTIVIDGDGQQVSMTTTATVGGVTVIGNAPGQTGAATAGTPTVADLTLGRIYAAPNPDASGYTAIVDWGDGTSPTDANLETNTGGPPDLGYYLLVVTSGHTYAEPGQYNVSMTVRDAQGFEVGAGSTGITVNGLTMTAITTPPPNSGFDAGTSTGPLTVGTITPPFSPDPAASTGYTAVVDWGDGSPTVDGSLVVGDGGVVDINTSGHTYSQAGTYTLTVTVRDSEGFVVGMVQPMIAVQNPASGGGSSSAASGVPEVQVVTFDRRTATAVITYQGSLGGTALAALSDAALYRLAVEPLSRSGHGRAAMKPTRITVTPGASGTSTDVATVVFHRGRPLRGSLPSDR